MTAPPSGVSGPGPSAPDHLPPEPPNAIVTGLLCRCPRCGKGPLFSGVLKIADRCKVCGLDLSKQDAGDGPAVFVIFILGAIFFPLVIWVEFSLEPAWWVHLVVWPLPVLLTALAFLHPLKGLLVALQFRHHASDSGLVDYSEDDK
ncbi:DUF983 domain-containing protein [Pelagibius sp. 7325]|uniref:DUF983 domain-containing protein n=1 Tax=Pelagibius sp. 7325 TaxID=3131994 RepID=UPI0030EF16CC